MDFREIKSKTILTRCGIPGIDFVINPYVGCRFGCKYCYASFMGRFVNKKIEDWGEYVYVKINTPELLKKELKKLKNKGKGKEVFLSSVTDPYQGLEAKYKLTRQCLQILLEFGYQGFISILTKSDLVLRDIDIFRQLQNVAVGLTVTSADDGISRYFEKYAPPVSARFSALKILNQNKIRTYAFIGPLLPHFVGDNDSLEKIFKKLAEIGTKDLYVEHLNLTTYIRTRLVGEIRGVNKNVIDRFYLSQTKSYRENLDKIVKTLVNKYRMKLLTGGTIFHQEYQKN